MARKKSSPKRKRAKSLGKIKDLGTRKSPRGGAIIPCAGSTSPGTVRAIVPCTGVRSPATGR